jgi:hypothetical protein
MRTLKQGLVLVMAGGMLTPALSAQSLWQKLKQAAKQEEQNAKAAQNHGTAATTGAAHSAAVATAHTAANQGPAGSPELTAQLAAATPTFTVAGIRLGMSVKDAMAALKAHNKLLTVTPQPATFELIPNQQLLPKVEANEPITGTTPHEQVSVYFTMAPNAPVVDGITRDYSYPEGTQPSWQKTLEAIKATYGDPSIPLKNLAQPEFQWFYDASGKQLSDSQVANAPRYCNEQVIDQAAGIVEHGYQTRVVDEDLHTGEVCGKYTVLIMRFQVANRPSGEKVVTYMSTSAIAGPLYRSAAQATHAQYLAAQQAKDKQDKHSTDKNQVSF